MEIKLEELRKRKIMVATPMYGGNCHGMYAKACADLSKLCQAYDVSLNFFYLFNESLITRARNYCVDEFLRSDCTHLMFIDSDIGFDPHDVLSLAAFMDPDAEADDRKEIMCGPYPKKTIAWEKIKTAVDKGFADKDPNDLEKFVGDFVFNPKDTEDGQIRIDQPCKVLEGGTGFMMVQRSAFEKFDKAYPDFTYLPDHVRTTDFDGSREIMMYFQALIDPDSKRYLSEDYMFCQWMSKVGVETWLCPWMKMVHVGTYHFGGSLPDLAALGVSATADESVLNKSKKKKKGKK
jgi:hypothetical protein